MSVIVLPHPNHFHTVPNKEMQFHEDAVSAGMGAKEEMWTREEEFASMKTSILMFKTGYTHLQDIKHTAIPLKAKSD